MPVAYTDTDTERNTDTVSNTDTIGYTHADTWFGCFKG
jgi:hypothetical protein